MLSYVPGFQKFPELLVTIHPPKRNNTYLDKETNEKLYIFSNYDDLNGEVHLKLNENSTFDHIGVHLELIGIIKSKNDDYKFEFLNMSKELEPPGELVKSMSYNFSFKKVSLPHESYQGSSIFINYFVRITIIKKVFATKLAVEKNFIVYNPLNEPKLNATIKTEVGLTNLIHFEYELYHNKFHLEDCVIGKLYFIKVNMKVKLVELQFIKMELMGSGSNQKVDLTIISKFELVDGSPVSNEMIPIRFFLNDLDLSPTYRDLNNILSVKYFLKFVIIDEEDKSFFKQQEIFLWRKYN